MLDRFQLGGFKVTAPITRKQDADCLRVLDDRDLCLTLGLTGNPGAGKSAVADMLEEWGAEVVNADAVGYETLRRDSPVFSELVETFGASILDERGEISRVELGWIVFPSSAQLERLNQIVHPVMLRRIQERMDSFRRLNERSLFVLDAALIYEWEIEDWFDAVVVVTAPIEIRRKRFLAARGGTEENFNNREAAQLPESEKIQRADFAIQNDGGLDALKHNLKQCLDQFIRNR